MKTCSTCKQHKKNDEFYKHGRTKDGLSGFCKSCVKEYNSNRYSTLNGRAKILVNNAKIRSRKKNLDFDISVADVYEKIVTGVCEFTGISFDYSYGKDRFLNAYSPSIDKIDSKKGYTKDNIRLVLTSVNRALGEDGEDEMLPILKAMVEAIENNAKQKESTPISTKHPSASQEQEPYGVVHGAWFGQDCDGAHHHRGESEGQDISDSSKACCGICMGAGDKKLESSKLYAMWISDGHTSQQIESIAKRLGCICHQS